ncbi:alkene reductase [Xanthomonas arboricola]|uniref:N-ethylmaleimide reductase n=2 Tax=Xanthomonas arboricola TaxID=56448 RepID=A0ABM8RZP1_9XANT|nr:alkene reductase [Xanthomonas arboricola]MDN0209260.1 alkene reductase [Xanthomonas arboricola pv. corylina]MDN0213655.1 alkene reductase [Xanthomonas arboricola pv. corylina]QUI82629.1 alkene reductase [Xanthomonas arboricola pv. corylina]UQQ12703.1 alkene reductase [Xanthomonas arboricola pv. corylina]WIX25308.1 alkene reductase [Xanthomonas arboricola pv. corylina]
MPATKTLLSPFQLGPYTLRNRVVMAPLTRSRAGEDDAPTSLAVDYYRQRATAGLIVTEGSQISPQGKGYPRTPGIFSGAQVAGWEQVTKAVHAEGGRIFLQLWHVGRLSHSTMQLDGGLPVAPSAIAADGEIYTATGPQPYETPRALGTEEIPGIVADFRRAAENAKRAGFDGVEVHGANGYIIDQFLRDGSNRRTDAYGGSVENRVRFLKEIVEAVIPVFGADRVGVRLSPTVPVFSMSDSDPVATFGHAAETLARYGLAYLHVVQLGDPDFDYAALKRHFGGTYIANGGFDADSAEAAITGGTADLVAFGQKFLANPDLVERFRQGATLNQPDPTTFYQGEDRGYTDYPTLNV